MEKKHSPIEQISLQIHDHKLRRGFNTIWESFIYMFLVNAYFKFYVLAILLKSSIPSLLSSFSGSYFTEKIKALRGIPGFLSPFISNLFVHLYVAFLFVTLIGGQQTGARGLNSAHCLFLYRLPSKDGFYFLNGWRGNKFFCNMQKLYKIKISANLNQVLVEHNHAHLFIYYLWEL